jgi:hypothetical protein
MVRLTPHRDEQLRRAPVAPAWTLVRLSAAAGAVVLSLSWSSAMGRTRASAARVLEGADTAHLHLLHAGEDLTEEGPSSGILPGHMRAELRVGPVFTGSFTIYTDNGRISGSGTANPHGSGRYQSFSGAWTVTSGSGVYAHVHGHDSMYGVFDRRTYDVVVTTTGSLSY